MTDHTIPADLSPDDVTAARQWAENVLTRPQGHILGNAVVARALLALLPAPTRPTLADMTDDERRACQWMQADVWPGGRAVITFPDSGHEPATLIDRQGKVIYASSYTVTPRPDLPRLEWPSTTPVDEPAPNALTPGSVWTDGAALNAAVHDSEFVVFATDRDGDPVTYAPVFGWSGRGFWPRPDSGGGPWTVLYVGEAGQ